LKQSGKIPAEDEVKKNLVNEKSIRFQIPDDSDDSKSYISGKSSVIDKNREEIEAFLNRKTRGGDMSPFRSNKMKFNNKKKASGLDGFDNLALKKGTTMRPQMRKISVGMDNAKKTKKNFETPKFSMTSKNKNSGSSNTGTFGDISKSRSAGASRGTDLELDKNDEENIPKLNFGGMIIEEESKDGYSPSMVSKAT
jgi:hypothetical protein